LSDNVIDDGSTRGVVVVEEESRHDALGDDDESELDVITVGSF